MNAELPVVAEWFTASRIDERVTLVVEPHAHEFVRGNIWHIRGDERDLVVDAGLGVASLRAECPQLFAKDPALVITHAHLDHMGSAHEFSERIAHPAEHPEAPTGTSILGAVLGEQLGIDDELPELLITARPPGFDPGSYRLRPAPITRPVADGDVIDLGGVELRVLHLPGHTPGSICLLDEASGALFSGDVVYDDVLLDGLHESDRADYRRSMRRLAELPVRVVHPGHGPSFGRGRLLELIDDYLASSEPGSTPASA